MKLYGLCNLAVVPLRISPSHKSEMVSQVLFGECFEILDLRESWALIRLAYDQYEGWVDDKQFVQISDELFGRLNGDKQHLADLSSHSFCLKLGKDEMVNILPGTTIPLLDDTKFSINNQDYLFVGDSSLPDASKFHAQLEETAQFYLNAPYLWGGRTFFGIDCSGFSQLVYKHLGVKIKRDAAQQAEEGRVVDFLQEAVPGDLAFFDNEHGKVTHVGIILDDLDIIHASGRVKVDRIDEQGIFCLDSQKYTHKLRIIRRIIE